MRVLFMGTPTFSVPSLEALDDSFDVVGVVTRPDAVRGRGKTLEPSPVKVAAQARGLEVFEAKRITPELLETLGTLDIDVVAVAAFGALLPPTLLELPSMACVNVHGSLLPRWRGAAPIQRAILAGDRVAGVSIMEMVEELDAGRYCLTGEVPCEGKTSAQLMDELSHLGARLLVQALALMETDPTRLTWHVQDEEGVTYAKKIEKAEMHLDPADSAVANLRRVLASNDQAPARLSVDGRGMRVLDARPVAGLGARPGHLRIQHGRVALGCADGVLELLQVKPDGKRAMAAHEWAQGQQHEVVDWERI